MQLNLLYLVVGIIFFVEVEYKSLRERIKISEVNEQFGNQWTRRIPAAESGRKCRSILSKNGSRVKREIPCGRKEQPNVIRRPRRMLARARDVRGSTTSRRRKPFMREKLAHFSQSQVRPSAHACAIITKLERFSHIMVCIILFRLISKRNF